MNVLLNAFSKSLNTLNKNLYKLKKHYLDEEIFEKHEFSTKKQSNLKKILFVFLSIFLCVIVIFFLIKNKNLKKKHSSMTITPEIEEYVDSITKRILKFKNVSTRNRTFRNLTQKHSLLPIKINNMSTVFYHTKKKIIIKRTLFKNTGQENEVSMAMKHPNLLKTLDYHFSTNDDGDEYLWLISEYMNVTVKGSYVDQDENILRNIMSDILKGLAYMHRNRIVHLDLKIANIMGVEDKKGHVTYKIIDFGFSRDFSLLKGNPESVVLKKKSYGTYPYKPYEIVCKNEHGFKSDIWCIGAICWFLIEGQTPFYTASGYKDKKGWYSFLKNAEVVTNSNVSDELYDFIDRCIRTNPDERPTAEELLESEFILNTKMPSTWVRRTPPGNFFDDSDSSTFDDTSSFIATT